MKRLIVSAALALCVASCGNGGSTGSQTEDTTSPASGATGQGLDGQGTRGGTGTGTDTTGLDVGAVQPIDSTTNSRPIGNEPGADRSNAGRATTGAGGQ